MKKITLFLVFCALFSCSKEEEITNTPVKNTVQTNYIRGTIDGAEIILQEDGTQNTYSVRQSYEAQFNTTDPANINYLPTMVVPFDRTKPTMGIEFIGFVRNTNIPYTTEKDVFDTLFKVGTYSFISDNTKEFGVKVNYLKGGENGTYYISNESQNNATFTITEVSEPTTDDKLFRSVILSGTFNCRVYNLQNQTDFIDIKNGRFRLTVKSFYSLLSSQQ